MSLLIFIFDKVIGFVFEKYYFTYTIRKNNYYTNLNRMSTVFTATYTSITVLELIP